YSPTIASTVARAPNTLESVAIMRSVTSDSSNWRSSVFISVNRQVGIDLVERRPHDAERHIWIALGTDVHVLRIEHDLRRAHVHDQRHLVAQALVSRIVHDTDDLDIGLGSRIASQTDMTAHRDAVTEISLDEAGVD